MLSFVVSRSCLHILLCLAMLLFDIFLRQYGHEPGGALRTPWYGLSGLPVLLPMFHIYCIAFGRLYLLCVFFACGLSIPVDFSESCRRGDIAYRFLPLGPCPLVSSQPWRFPNFGGVPLSLGLLFSIDVSFSQRVPLYLGQCRLSSDTLSSSLALFVFLW